MSLIGSTCTAIPVWAPLLRVVRPVWPLRAASLPCSP